MLVDIAPGVCKLYVTMDWNKGNKQLLVQCQNVTYGTMVASLLYYHRFCKSLTYIIRGKQMTIAFRVDDCKLSHKHPKEMDIMINQLREEYESIFEDGSGKMAVSRRKVHTYLGITLDYTIPGRVKITMINYIKEIIGAFHKAEPNGGGS